MMKRTFWAPFVAGAFFCLLTLTVLAFRDGAGTVLPKAAEKALGGTARALPQIPGSLSFAGEAVPLDRWEVRERFDRELMQNYYNESNMHFLLKLANRYFPVISARLEANGVPDDFKYLCVAESNLLSGAASPAGAVGFWQFLSGTATGYGLENHASVDMRRDLEASTDAACRYLKTAYGRFGSWTAAAASYNCGMGGYNSQVSFQGTRNYYDLQLPEETNRYIFRILAFKQLMGQAAAYGYDLDEEVLYDSIPYRTVQVSATVPNLAAFARAEGTTYRMLRVMNPWIKGRSLPVSKGRTYTVRLPSEEQQRGSE